MSARQRLHLPREGGSAKVKTPLEAIVVGGGIAGLAAATILAERGVRVTIVEREGHLGGRAGSWADRHEDGSTFEMERGFHAFFRQYYNLRALLRRIDPGLAMLRPLADYPILGHEGAEQSFAGLPKHTPWNLLALTRRTPALHWRELRGVNVRAALEMIRYAEPDSAEKFDAASAQQYLDSLSFPPRARRLLFDVFAHSFFNPEAEMSAGELLSMFHFYFTGNPEGLLFDVARAPFGRALWEPLARYLEARGARIERHVQVEHCERQDSRWRVALRATAAGAPQFALTSDMVVLALPVSPLRAVVAASPPLRESADFSRQIEALRSTSPFAVWRLWLDRPMHAMRAPFVGTTGFGALDNISLYDRFQDESEAWALRQGGSVVELHAYAVAAETDATALRQELLRGLHTLYPESAPAQILAERFLWRDDCPAFAPGTLAQRPAVQTPFPDLVLAGDFVRLPFPSALMERAAASGILAANTLLAQHGVRPEPIETISGRGWLAPRRMGRMGRGAVA